jgi:hypothetical protein
VRASSEAESCPRGRLALERGGVSPEGASSPLARRSLTEGASSPLARRSLTRGGVQPSSEAECRPRGHPTLERSGVSSEGPSSPRARRSLVSTVLCPSSEMEFHSRGLGLTVLMGHRGRQDHGPLPLGCDCLGRVLCFVSAFVFCCLRTKMGFPRVFRGPLWLSPTTSSRVSERQRIQASKGRHKDLIQSSHPQRMLRLR